MVPRKGKKKRANVAESTLPLLLSEKKTPQSLKAENKIVKKSTNQNSAGEKALKITHQVQGSDDVGKTTKKTLQSLKPKIVKKSTKQNAAREKGVKITHQVQGRDNNEQTTNTKDKQIKNDGESDGVKNLKHPSSQNENKEKHEESSRRDQKAEKNLGGLIFMCNRKTKADCFRYLVMGVSTNKKEVVMGIRPGFTLFLYDFELRLLYGIYKASSVGGMKLEPAAFGGAFPAQVRFKVHKDCLPLPESVFKRAIKDNYDGNKHKFKTELTIEQVKKLTELFQPVPVLHSNANSSVQEPLPIINPLPTAFLPGEEAHVGRLYRDQYISSQAAAGHLMPLDHDRKQILEHYIPPSDLASPSALFLSEKEYRSYGLRGERHNVAATVPAVALDPHRANRELEQLQRNPASVSDEALKHKATVRPDKFFLSEKDYRTYGLRGRCEVPQTSARVEYKPPVESYPEDLYNPYHYSTTSLVNRYLSQPMTVAATESLDMPFRGTYENDGRSNLGRLPQDEGRRLSTTYASGAPSDSNKKYHHLGEEHGSRSTPVSSRYSFAGPSVLYR